MSFRFTNDLITTFKQKALMAHYTNAFLYPRTFVGYCAGVSAKVNSSCQLLELKVDDASRATFIEASSTSSSSSSLADGDAIAQSALDSAKAADANTNSGTVDSKKLAKAIEMAVYDATRKVKAAKEEYYRLSVKNARLLTASKELIGEGADAMSAELATVRDLTKYGLSTDSALIGPHPWDSFRDRSAFHTLLNTPNYNANNEAAASAGVPAPAPAAASETASKEFGLSKPMTLADILPEYRAAFLSYPAGALNSTIKDVSAGRYSTNAPSSSSSSSASPSSSTEVTAEQRKASVEQAALADRLLAQKEVRQMRAAAAEEEAKDELAFWTRVEAIRKGQQAVIGSALNKRPYKDQAGSAPVSNFEEKIQLRFIDTN